MAVPICLPSTSLAVFPDSASMLLLSNKGETQSDYEAEDVFQSSSLGTDNHAFYLASKACPLPQQVTELREHLGSKVSKLPRQPKMPSADRAHRECLCDAPTGHNCPGEKASKELE